MNFWLRCLFLVSVWIPYTLSWADEPLVVAPEKSEVDITTDFAGTDFKTVGAMNGPGELIIKLVGPPHEATLSRERKLGPFWIEGPAVRMVGAPSLLYLYATAPIASILSPAEQARYGLFLESVPVRIERQMQAYAAEDWGRAFYRLKERQGYYREDDSAIRVFGNRLFIANMRLPGDLRVGKYTIEILLVRSGKVVGHKFGEFDVRLAGIEHWVWASAHDYPWSFGALFTLLAMLLGFVLNVISYRRAR
ncbi:MAG: TIGR02186 family protein [Burkholderiales bacterium]